MSSSSGLHEFSSTTSPSNIRSQRCPVQVKWMLGHREVWDHALYPARLELAMPRNYLLVGPARGFLLPLVEHNFPTFEYLFYCSVRLSTDFFPQDRADCNKNAFISLPLPKGKRVPTEIVFSSFLCEGTVGWLPGERGHVSPQ